LTIAREIACLLLATLSFIQLTAMTNALGYN